MRKTALITGATSGIGRATAELFAKKGFNLILCGRRQERLEELKNKLGRDTAIFTLKFDVRNREDVFAAIRSLPKEFSEIDILVNNAGNAHGLDPIDTVEPMLMICPDFRSTICGIIALDIYSKPFTLISNMASQSSGFPLSIGSKFSP